ncbi:hypothetical protein MBLNU459_g0045t3 [Dothideomycetes sp. NU459]
MTVPFPRAGTLTPLQSLLLRRWRPQWACPARAARNAALRRGHATATEADASKPYYVTTPIFYVNAAPHIGHLYTMVLTDVLKRWQLLKGRTAILCTGTDEHGMKIQQASAKAGSEPKSFCDKGADVFKTLAARVQLSNDHFVRTTDPAHREAVEYAWHLLNERGYIYQSKHEGWYSVSDETFYPESQVHLILDPPTGRKIMASIETGKEVEWTSEQNYHFRLSAFRDRLLEFYRENPQWISPRTKMSEVVASVESGLEDLSISRPYKRLTWGIRVPTDSDQTIYVWLDALLNYITKAGYPWAPAAQHTGGWPADVQVIGKDIVRFHCIYWPAFLMALDLPLPKRILSHAHWTLGRQKMAKSTGNVVNPFFALDRFGVDTMRYYLIRDGGIDNDADYDNQYIIERYKKGLQGGLGNLASRIMRGKGWSVQRAVERYHGENAAKMVTESSDQGVQDFTDGLDTYAANIDSHMQSLKPNLALKEIMSRVSAANVFLQAQSPWDIATKLKQQTANPDEPANAQLELQMDRVIYLCAENLRLSGILLQPFMPDKAKELLDMLDVQDDRRSWADARFGADGAYGPSAALGKGSGSILFPPLTSDS